MELTAPMTAALCFFGGVTLCLLACMAVKLKAAQTGGRKQQKKDKPPATAGSARPACHCTLPTLTAPLSFALTDP